MTKVLLDTNIIIHRENDIVTNYSIGHLYRWIDRLKLTKVIHPLTEEEISRYNDPNHLEVLKVKLEAYDKIYTKVVPTQDFYNHLKDFPEKTQNDKVDNQFLYEVYSKRVDLLITEDKRMQRKAEALGIKNKVFSIEQFINIASGKYPKLIEYKTLNVKPIRFGELNSKDIFFDSLRKAYPGFDDWLARKSEEQVYVCFGDQNKILGLLYLKIEDENDNDNKISPAFSPKRRLKIGTFKTESTGFRLGERFLKIIFDYAALAHIDEIYVTMYPNITNLRQLLEDWGFELYGKKDKELVLVKHLTKYAPERTPLQNFPLVNPHCNKFFLPIKPQYHKTLLPDAILNTENATDLLGNIAHRYALRKIYISCAFRCDAKPGDLLVFYRMGDKDRKNFSSVVTGTGIVSKIKKGFSSWNDFANSCQNRTVFPLSQLQWLWNNRREQLILVEFLFLEAFPKRPTLDFLRRETICGPKEGARPFQPLNDEQFGKIIAEAHKLGES